MLFILFINDLPDYIKSNVKIFADDLKLIVNSSDRKLVESDLKNLEKLERDWLLQFNIDKCEVLHLDQPRSQQGGLG